MTNDRVHAPRATVNDPSNRAFNGPSNGGTSARGLSPHPPRPPRSASGFGLLHSRFVIVGLVMALGLSGCVNITTPYDLNLERTEFGDKIGEAHWTSVLGLFAWGDAGTRAAAEDGGLTVVHHADVRTFAIGLIAFVRRTTIVYGE